MFAERIKTLRKDAGKTQQDLADHLKIRRSTYGEYERGKIVPPYVKIKSLADYFNVSVEFLMEGRVGEQIAETAEEEFARFCLENGMSKEDIPKLFQLTLDILNERSR